MPLGLLELQAAYAWQGFLGQAPDQWKHGKYFSVT